jgi:hypothetical protein
MYAVVGLTLNDVSEGALPQVRLAEALEERAKHGRVQSEASRIVVYTTDGADTQGLIARTKYKEHGAFLVFLYFSASAVQVCQEHGIPLRIVDQVEERGLPAKRVTVLEYPQLAAR